MGIVQCYISMLKMALTFFLESDLEQ